MSVTLTKEQLDAISSRGKVIVSASAGSGKTFVMIERLVQLILGGADVRKVLAVTFTNKAAVQMKERLRSALLKRIAESDEKERTRIKEQIAALPLADISTIHSFCSHLVRTYFYIVGVDPAFRIISSEDAEGRFLSARAMNEAFEEFYEQGGGEFETLLSAYFYKKKDLKLRKIVGDLYSSVRGRADYRSLLEQTGKEDAFEEICAYLYSEFTTRLQFFADSAEDIGVFFAESKSKAVSVCADIIGAANTLLETKDLFSMAMTAQEKLEISRMPSSSKLSGEELKRHVRLKALSKGIKDLYADIRGISSREEEYRRYLSSLELARGLAVLILKYDEIYTRLKQEASALDYDDLEHCAMKVLENEEAIEAIREKYDYIFVDEYQDVNPAQERILSLVGGEEMFLVGDAKQSIYGFRGSRSEYFVQKGREFPSSLLLTENFRSSSAVLDAVNRVFSYAMTKESSGICYLDALMRGGSRYGEHSGGVFFHKITEKKSEKEERGVYSVLKESAPERDAQAEYIAQLIEEEIGSEWYDADTGLIKTVSYGDIAVLVRKMSGDAEKVVSLLSERNIPVTTTASVNVCDFWEARLLIDWLSYLDNAEQDIPLAGALLSRIGGFTDSELAGIRTYCENICEKDKLPYTFRDACRLYLKTYRERRKKGACDTVGEKLDAFEKKTEVYRALQRVKSAGEMMNLLLSDGLEAEIAAKKDGENRLRRVRRLILEGEGNTNEFLRRIKAAGKVEYSESGGEEAVKVLTMHAAKGLEYPVVILASLDAPFHGPDRDEVLSTDRFGFAPKSYDLENKIVYDTLLRRASEVYMEKEELKGELNVLYVAMTRAKYRLHMLFSGKNDAPSPQYAKRFSDFIDFDDCAQYFAEEKESAKEPIPRSALAFRPDDTLLKQIMDVYKRPYPYAESVSLPVKSSASELMQQSAEPDFRYGGGTGVRSSAEEGVAYHAFLQYVRFGKSAEEELTRMREEGLLGEELVALLKTERLEKMLSLPALKALEGRAVYREQTFLASVPACELLETEAADEIVLQGAIDLLYADEEGYMILDYKYSSLDVEQLKEKYALQISIYRKAVSRVMKIEERTIRAKIINILRLEEIDM